MHHPRRAGRRHSHNNARLRRSKDHTSFASASARSTRMAYGGSASGSDLPRTVQIPQDESGAVDWNTLGSILTSHILAEVSLAAAIDLKHCQGAHQASSSKSSEWEFLYEERNVTVFRKKFKNSPVHSFLGRGVVDKPLKQVASFVANIRSTYTWDKYLKSVKCVKVLHEADDHIDYIGYQQYETTHCLVKTKRDLLYFVRCFYYNGKYIQTALSVEHHDCPVFTGIKRVQCYPGSGWVMEPHQGSDSKTLVSYLAHLDLQGLPPLIMHRVLRRHPLAIHYITQHLKTVKQQCTNTQLVAIDDGSREEETACGIAEHLDSTFSQVSTVLYEETLDMDIFTHGKFSPLNQWHVSAGVWDSAAMLPP